MHVTQWKQALLLGICRLVQLWSLFRNFNSLVAWAKYAPESHMEAYICLFRILNIKLEIISTTNVSC